MHVGVAPKGGASPLMSAKTAGTSDLSILTTEHFTLQSARQLCLQDMQNRSTLFLTAVSASLVAISFFGSATQFHGAFFGFVLSLLISLWVLGTLTWTRVVQAAIEDVIISFGIARIHHRYTEIAPDIQPLLVRSIHDDFAGINREMGSTQEWWQKLMPTYVAISFVTSVLSGSAVAFTLSELAHATPAIEMLAAFVTFIINIMMFKALATRLWSNVYRFFPPLYPS